MLGTLKSSVSAAGKATLTFAGKPARTLKAGRYTVVVEDPSKQAGLVVADSAGHSTTLSGAAAVGRSSRTLTLSAGTWSFVSAAGGQKTYFSVVK